MSTTTTTLGCISFDVPAVPLHKIAAKERGRYGMDRVSLVRLPEDKRRYWALPDALPDGWDGWTLQATDGRALVVLPVSPDVSWDDIQDAELDLPIARWSWNAKEYGRLVGKKTKARDGFHRLDLEGDLLVERARWVSETAGGFLEGVRGDGEGEWPRTELVLPDARVNKADHAIGVDAGLLATVQDCVGHPDKLGVKLHLAERTSPIMVTGPRGFGVVMPITRE